MYEQHRHNKNSPYLYCPGPESAKNSCAFFYTKGLFKFLFRSSFHKNDFLTFRNKLPAIGHRNQIGHIYGALTARGKPGNNPRNSYKKNLSHGKKKE